MVLFSAKLNWLQVNNESVSSTFAQMKHVGFSRAVVIRGG